MNYSGNPLQSSTLKDLEIFLKLDGNNWYDYLKYNISLLELNCIEIKLPLLIIGETIPILTKILNKNIASNLAKFV